MFFSYREFFDLMSQTPPSQPPTPVISPEIEKMKEDIAAAAREIFARGLVNPGEGNISMRIGKTEEILITPSYNQYAKCSATDIVHMKFDGTKLSQGRPASTEYKLHVAIYNDRKKVKCVIHTHSPCASILSVLHKGIPVLMEEQVSFLGGSVECAEFGSAHTEQLPANALKALGTNNAVLMANHGAMVCGSDMEYTVNIATLLEKMARIYLGCLEVGDPIVVPDDKLQKFKEYFEARATYSRKKKEGAEGNQEAPAPK
jgi:ribulose-5-phosphate 4-epimerase/fuculose-1-phosphate aldolase